jgi:hypothetical protein
VVVRLADPWPPAADHPMIALDSTTDFACLTHESGDPRLDLDEIFYDANEPAAIVVIPDQGIIRHVSN